MAPRTLNLLLEGEWMGGLSRRFELLAVVGTVRFREIGRPSWVPYQPHVEGVEMMGKDTLKWIMVDREGASWFRVRRT